MQLQKLEALRNFKPDHDIHGKLQNHSLETSGGH